MAPLALVTGAAGFLGGHVARHFAAAGYRVVGRGHGHIAKSALAELGLSDWREDDVTLSTLAGLNATPDVVVHCAGGASISHSVAYPEDDYRRTVDTMREVLDYVRLHAPAARVVLPSSAAVYGEVAHLPIGEDTPLAPISPYGHHKKLAEELCRFYAQDYGLRIGIVRLFSVYGPGLRKQLLWDACEKLRKGNSIFSGTGNERRDWLHVADAVALLAVAAENASHRCPIVNGGSGTSVSVNEVLRKLAALFPGAPLLTFSGVPRPGDPIGYQADISRAREWAWRPKLGLDQGLAEFVHWYSKSIS